MDLKQPVSPVQPYLQAARDALRMSQSWIAVARLKEALAIVPDSAEAHELLGIAQLMAHDIAAARQAFVKATACDPRSSSAHYNYAVFLAHMGELDEAVAEIHAVLYIAPGHTGALKLQRSLAERLRAREAGSAEGFAVAQAGSAPSVYSPSGRLLSLECPYCHAMNHVTARVCRRCNMRLPDENPVIVLE